jgi:uncharacterized Zn finger protein
MTTRAAPSTRCENMNHRRANSPVSHCPQCGDVVNRQISNPPCSDAKHAASRRQRSAFCVDCGARLIVTR